MKALVVGADSMLGGAIILGLEEKNIEVVKTSRRVLDKGSNILTLDFETGVENFKIPDQIDIAFICAGISTSAQCEKQPDISYHINVYETVELITRLVNLGIFVVFPSSSSVFDGTISFPTVATACSPVGEYGRQKAKAEQQILSLASLVAIVRISKIITNKMPLFLKWKDLLESGRDITCFEDFMLSPVSETYVSKLLIDIALHKLTGIYQISASHDISYRDVAYRIVDHMRISRKHVLLSRAKNMPEMKETFRENASLDCSLLRENLGISPPQPLEAFDEIFLNYKDKNCD
jgi:dTDP-4-dehydrorhamnose reductase